MYGGLWYDVGVESVTEIDGVDVVTVAQKPISVKIELSPGKTKLSLPF